MVERRGMYHYYRSIKRRGGSKEISALNRFLACLVISNSVNELQSVVVKLLCEYPLLVYLGGIILVLL